MLTGQSTERSLMNGHEALSVWNIVSGDEVALLKPVHRALLLRDALRTNHHGGLEFGPAARALIKGEARLSLVVPPKRERKGRRAAPVAANPADNPLFEALRAKRRELAQEAGCPLRDLPRLGAARHGGATSDQPGGAVVAVGDRRAQAGCLWRSVSGGDPRGGLSCGA
ncbi:hypothetical protein GCM10020258_14600 [Sphingomonas yabuuchiae]